jgi:hypothetical protein
VRANLPRVLAEASRIAPAVAAATTRGVIPLARMHQLLLKRRQIDLFWYKYIYIYIYYEYNKIVKLSKKIVSLLRGLKPLIDSIGNVIVKTNSGKSSTRLAINSNLGTDVDIDRLLDSTTGMAIDVYTSNEAIATQAEYIRDGLVWADWANNVERLLDSQQFRGIHVMCTINALCLTTLDQLLECIANWKLKYGRDAISFTLNILRFPSFQSPLVLPDHIRTKYKNQLVDFLVRHAGKDYMHEHELNHLQRLIDYLDVVKTPHSESFDMPKLLNDFKQFYAQYDQRRSKDFGTTFPELREWYDAIQV